MEKVLVNVGYIIHIKTQPKFYGTITTFFTAFLIFVSGLPWLNIHFCSLEEQH
jgi:hypothetical protein